MTWSSHISTINDFITSIYIPSSIATHSRWLSLSSLALIKLIVLISVHQASHLQIFRTQRFFINNTVETTERSLLYNSVFFILLQHLLWLITAKALSLTNPTVLAQVKPHLRKTSANSYRTSEPHVFLCVTGQFKFH